ncbi:hypothetical protein NQT74_14655 [Alteromonas stellipolaris]|uniref:hypothetical protein n=1 Tax=Alteromonas stellipolaris TaxID=233316 RepID=UPI0021176E57|nr:hypothetical protein [Alteromonas stellipolaris]MCQ8849824.1 hypothetical protein [Alteromonas stellipolaris]
MNLEVLGTIMGSFGGAAVIVAALAKFLSKVWTDRLAKETSAKINKDLEVLKAGFSQDLELLKSKSTQDLELIKSKSTQNLEKIKAKNTEALEQTKHALDIIKGSQEQFGGISLEFYQKFFDVRIDLYLELLDIKNKYIEEMEEEFATEVHEGWGIVYYTTYISLRKLMIKKQLYISNELEESFSELRKNAFEFMKEADMQEVLSREDETPVENEQLRKVYDRFAESTDHLMESVMVQIGKDVSKLRARIELDKA